MKSFRLVDFVYQKIGRAKIKTGVDMTLVHILFHADLCQQWGYNEAIFDLWESVSDTPKNSFEGREGKVEVAGGGRSLPSSALPAVSTSWVP